MAKENATPLIQAAGAVLWRKDRNSEIEIAIIHRPKYDDWSLPKGKVEPGESHISAGYREIQEETGYESIFGPEIGTVVYNLEGAPKEVRYWAAAATEQTGKPNPEEVDQGEPDAVPVLRQPVEATRLGEDHAKIKPHLRRSRHLDKSTEAHIFDWAVWRVHERAKGGSQNHD